MTDRSNLVGRTDFCDERVSLVEIAGKEGVINGFKFIDCEIQGPAVILIDGEFEILGNRIDGSPNDFLWEISKDRKFVVGAILVKDTAFRGCTFSNIGIAGHQDFIDEMRRSLVAEPAAI